MGGTLGSGHISELQTIEGPCFRKQGEGLLRLISDLHTCTHTNTHTHIHTEKQASPYKHMHIHKHAPTYTHIWAHTNTYPYVYIFAHTQTCTHIYAQIHTKILRWQDRRSFTQQVLKKQISCLLLPVLRRKWFREIPAVPFSTENP